MHMCSHTVAIEKIKPVKAARSRSFSKLKCIKTMRGFFSFFGWHGSLHHAGGVKTVPFQTTSSPGSPCTTLKCC